MSGSLVDEVELVFEVSLLGEVALVVEVALLAEVTLVEAPLLGDVKISDSVNDTFKIKLSLPLCISHVAVFKRIFDIL